MEVVTVRKIPPELARALRRCARESGRSLNQTVLTLLEERLGVGVARGRRRRNLDLLKLAGSWTRREADAFDRALAAQRRVDPAMWK